MPFELPLNAASTIVLSITSMFCFYTAYDKGKGQLRLQPLTDVLCFKGGLDATLVQLNKVLALAAFLILALPFVPGSDRVFDEGARGEATRWPAVYMLWAHMVYSFIRYYNTRKYPPFSRLLSPSLVGDWNSDSAKLRTEAMKRVSLFAAYTGQAVIAGWYLGYYGVDEPVTVAAALGLACTHFVLMESSPSWVIGVRPYGFTPLIAGVLGTTYAAWRVLFA